MRQWLVNPKLLCNKYLFGEHLEHHMFVGSLNKHKTVDGYLKNNLLEPLSLVKRHDDLAEKMVSRGFNHKSPIAEPDLSYLSEEQVKTKINTHDSFGDLMARCPACLARVTETKTHGILN